MFKPLVFLLGMLAASAAFSFDAKLCENHAAFVEQIATARDKGRTEADIKALMIKTVKEHGDALGVTEAELDEILQLVHVVYEHPQFSPEYLSNNYLNYCMSLKEVNVEVY